MKKLRVHLWGFLKQFLPLFAVYIIADYFWVDINPIDSLLNDKKYLQGTLIKCSITAFLLHITNPFMKKLLNIIITGTVNRMGLDKKEKVDA